MAFIIVKTNDNYLGSFWKFNIYIDGKNRVSLTLGEEKKIEVGEGPHSLEVLSQLGRSKKFNVNLKYDEVMNIKCGVTENYLKFFLLFYYVFRTGGIIDIYKETEIIIKGLTSKMINILTVSIIVFIVGDIILSETFNTIIQYIAICFYLLLFLYSFSVEFSIYSN